MPYHGQGLFTGNHGKGHAAYQVPKRHRKLQKDQVKYCISKGDIRRLARRGGVKRIQKQIYLDVRNVIQERLQDILRRVSHLIECTGPRGRNNPRAGVVRAAGRKIVTTMDIVYVLKQLGSPLYFYGGNVWPVAGIERMTA